MPYRESDKKTTGEEDKTHNSIVKANEKKLLSARDKIERWRKK